MGIKPGNRIQIMGLVMFLFLIPPSSAWTIDNSHHVYETNNANISFPSSQTFTSIETGADFIALNGNNYTIISSQQVNVYINRYDTATEFYNITISPPGIGTYEYIQKVGINSVTYNTYANGVFFQAVSSNSTGWIDNTVGVTGTNITLTYPELSPTQATGTTCGAYIKSIVDVLVILFIGVGGALGLGFVAATWKGANTSGLQAGIIIYVFMLILALVGIAIVLQMANTAAC